MNKTELIAAVAEKAEISKKDAEKAVKAFTDAVAERFSQLDSVTSKSARDQHVKEETQEPARP